MAATGMLHLQFPGQEHAVLSQLNTMRLQSQLCDVTVWAGGQKFHCHQAVLAASSGHFHSIFVQGVLCFPKKPTNETLDLSFISAEVFSIILDYVYTANIHCPTGIVADVLQAAKTLEIEPLTTQLPAFVGGATPISGLNNTSVPSVSVEKPPPSSITPSVGGSELNVPNSLAEMLSEPEENTDQPAGQSAMEDVVVKQDSDSEQQNSVCDLCGKEITSNERPQFDDSNTSICHACSESSHGQPTLQHDSDFAHGDKPFQCDHCGKSYKSYGGYMAHRSVHAPEEYGCKDCGEKFSDKTSLYRHRGKAHIIPKLKCDTCGRFFHQPSHLKEHMKTHMGDEARIYKCPTCPASFKWPKALKKHQTIHEGQKTCAICNKSYNGSRQLKRHMSAAHKEESSN